MRMPSDEELLLASGRGDRDAFTVIVERHHRVIIRFIQRFLATADHATAEDLAQQVFLSAWEYAPTFLPRAKVVTWLFRIATNACLNHRRRERSRIPVVAPANLQKIEQDDRAGEVGRNSADEERAQRVRAAIAALPANQRAAVVLRHYHDFSYAEIATIMATSTSAVDSLLHRARRKLLERLGTEEKGDNSPQVS